MGGLSGNALVILLWPDASSKWCVASMLPVISLQAAQAHEKASTACRILAVTVMMIL
jgi:hypothetical protein